MKNRILNCKIQRNQHYINVGFEIINIRWTSIFVFSVLKEMVYTAGFFYKSFLQSFVPLFCVLEKNEKKNNFTDILLCLTLTDLHLKK